jgi:hypothetical protein
MEYLRYFICLWAIRIIIDQIKLTPPSLISGMTPAIWDLALIGAIMFGLTWVMTSYQKWMLCPETLSLVSADEKNTETKTAGLSTYGGYNLIFGQSSAGFKLGLLAGLGGLAGLYVSQHFPILNIPWQSLTFIPQPEVVGQGFYGALGAIIMYGFGRTWTKICV